MGGTFDGTIKILIFEYMKIIFKGRQSGCPRRERWRGIAIYAYLHFFEYIIEFPSPPHPPLAQETR
jgi:hypothetical protein